eukprot:404513-Pyramimonas_sp.AAC.1
MCQGLCRSCSTKVRGAIGASAGTQKWWNNMSVADRHACAWLDAQGVQHCPRIKLGASVL